MKRRGKTAARRLAALGLLLATLPACSPNAPEATREEGTGDVATADSARANALFAEAFEAYVAKDYATASAKCEESLALEETQAARDLAVMCEAAFVSASSKEWAEGATDSALAEWTKTREAGALKSVAADGITYNFRYCPKGTFAMGSPEDEEGRGGREGEAGGWVLERQHDVTLTKFRMLETEVTVGMWRSFVKATNYQTGSGRMGRGIYGVTEEGTMFLDSKYNWDNPGYPQTE